MELDNLNIPCGCEGRKEIMGSGDWQKDAVVAGVLLLVVCCVIGGKYL